MAVTYPRSTIPPPVSRQDQRLSSAARPAEAGAAAGAAMPLLGAAATAAGGVGSAEGATGVRPPPLPST